MFSTLKRTLLTSLGVEARPASAPQPEPEFGRPLILPSLPRTAAQLRSRQIDLQARSILGHLEEKLSVPAPAGAVFVFSAESRSLFDVRILERCAELLRERGFECFTSSCTRSVFGGFGRGPDGWSRMETTNLFARKA